MHTDLQRKYAALWRKSGAGNALISVSIKQNNKYEIAIRFVRQTEKEAASWYYKERTGNGLSGVEGGNQG